MVHVPQMNLHGRQGIHEYDRVLITKKNIGVDEHKRNMFANRRKDFANESGKKPDAVGHW